MYGVQSPCPWGRGCFSPRFIQSLNLHDTALPLQLYLAHNFHESLPQVCTNLQQCSPFVPASASIVISKNHWIIDLSLSLPSPQGVAHTQRSHIPQRWAKVASELVKIIRSSRSLDSRGPLYQPPAVNKGTQAYKLGFRNNRSKLLGNCCWLCKPESSSVCSPSGALLLPPPILHISHVFLASHYILANLFSLLPLPSVPHPPLLLLHLVTDYPLAFWSSYCTSVHFSPFCFIPMPPPSSVPLCYLCPTELPP